jgi:hypothetical protein
LAPVRVWELALEALLAAAELVPWLVLLPPELVLPPELGRVLWFALASGQAFLQQVLFFALGFSPRFVIPLSGLGVLQP